MIEIYGRNNPDYEKNGDMTLFPEVCTVTAELNGAWYMDIIHPLDEEGRWKYITEEAVIAAPTFMGKKQLFRVDDMEKTDTEVTAKAYPVFFDSADDCFLFDVRPTGKNGQQALNEMTAGSKYSARSNITSGSTAYFVRRNLMDAINGEESPTFLERWGGEILFDNYTIIINEQVGADHGVEIRYGKNMAAVRYHVDMSQLVTRIVPVAFNGRTMSGNYVDSSNIRKYAKIYTREMRFENIKMVQDADGSEEEGTVICATRNELDVALRTACMQQYDSGIDLPAVTIEVDLVELSNTEDYKDFQALATIGLGDTVRCYNHVLDLSTEARAVKVVWDCIYDEIQEVMLGNYEQNYFTELSSGISQIKRVVTEDGGLMAEKVSGILNGIQTQLRLQNTVGEKQKVRAILFEDLDPGSELYGALSIGTQGWEIANKRTADKRDWEWTTAATANGIVADAVITGMLSDTRGFNFWNLDTGEFSLSSSATIDGETIQEKIENALKKQELSQEEILDILTNGGKDKGIYLLNGNLYISFNAAKGGTLTLGGSNNVSGSMKILDAAGKQIGSWGKDGFQTLGKYFAVDAEGVYSNNPKFGGTMYLSGSVSSSVNTATIEKTKAKVMSLAFVTSSSANHGKYTLYIGNVGNESSDSTWVVEKVDVRSPIALKTSAVTSGSTLVMNGGVVCTQSSSSARYKFTESGLSEKDTECLYCINPVWARYRDGYLKKGDEREGKYFPMLIAEDVEKNIPSAVNHNDDGSVEDWNHRVLIPYMIQALKEQKNVMDRLSERLKKLENKERMSGVNK